MTATQLQLRRDTATNLNAATPAAGEPGYDTTNQRLVIGNGSTLGGVKIPTAKDQQNQSFVTGTVGGTGDAITLTPTPAVAAYGNGLRLAFKATAVNTGATTMNVSGLGTRNIKKMVAGVATTLAANDIRSGVWYELIDDGTQFQVQGTFTGGTGVVLQIVEALSSTFASGTTTIPFDNTIPQNTEGQEFTQAALAVTPLNASSVLIIDFWAWVSLITSDTQTAIAGLFVDSTASALMAGAVAAPNDDGPYLIHFSYKVAAASTSARTYKLRYGGPTSGSGSWGINGAGAARLGGVMKSGIRVTEILI